MENAIGINAILTGQCRELDFGNVSKRIVVLLFLIGSAVVSSAYAQSMNEKSYSAQIGMGIWMSSNPFESANNQVDSGLFPYFGFDNKWLTIDPSGLSIKAVKSPSIRVDALLSPRWVFAETKNTSHHSEIERTASLDAGLRLSGTVGNFIGSVQVKADISGEVDGYEARLF